MVIVNKQGEIVLINAQTEKLFAYSREELLGKPVEVLVPERFRPTHVGQRDAYIGAPQTRPMGLGLELAARRRDGSEVPVEISLSPAGDGDARFVITIIRDVTERLRAREQATALAAEQTARERVEAAYGELRSIQSVTDVALAHLELDGGVTARIACSWFLPAGRDAVIECSVYGTEGAATVRNVDGSFYDFEAWRHRGTTTELLARPPDRWGVRALEGWAARLAGDRGYDAAAEEYLHLAEVLDAIYGRRP
jgi:PAS domain S-box-containing protein